MPLSSTKPLSHTKVPSSQYHCVAIISLVSHVSEALQRVPWGTYTGVKLLSKAPSPAQRSTSARKAACPRFRGVIVATIWSNQKTSMLHGRLAAAAAPRWWRGPLLARL